MRSITTLAVVVFCATAALPARAAAIQMHEPGLPYQALAHEKAPRAWLEREKWQSAALEGSSLRITHIRKTRPSDWVKAEGKAGLDPARLTRASFKSAGAAFDQPRDALFAFHVYQDSNYPTVRPVEPGTYRSHITVPQVVGAGWRIRLRLGEADWKLWAEYETGPDGKRLAGSLRLMAEPAAGGTALVLARPAHAVFSKQEILWLGDLNRDGVPDLVLKRTLITGEILYVMAIGPASGELRIDPHRPQQFMSYPDATTVTRHRDETVPLPTGRFGVSAFSISDEAWNNAVQKGDPMKPRTIGDRQLTLAGKTLRFTLEAVPLAGPDPAASVVHSGVHGDVFVKVHYSGRSQVLVQVSGPFRLQVGTLGGQPAIQVDHHSEHGGFTEYWILDETHAKGFRRLSAHHSTGC